MAYTGLAARPDDKTLKRHTEKPPLQLQLHCSFFFNRSLRCVSHSQSTATQVFRHNVHTVTSLSNRLILCHPPSRPPLSSVIQHY